MYLYIYDHFLQDKKYLNVLNRIEGRLTDLGINGRIEKLTVLKSLAEIIKEVKKREIDTLVVVGNDTTVSKVISVLPDLSLTIGIIPIGSGNSIAETLGIPAEEAACDVLSSRLIERLDLGKANNCYFLTSLILQSNPSLVLDIGSYHVSSLTDRGQISICNFKRGESEINNQPHPLSSPKDGIMEVVFTADSSQKTFFGIFKKQFNRSSVFPFKELKIKCSQDCLPATADGHTTVKTPISVSVAPKKLKVIVGKNRMFQ